MRITASALDAIKAHGSEGFPHEVCGLLIGHPEQELITETRRLRNIEADYPETRYLVDGKEDMQIRKDLRRTDLDVVGYYHSHPNHGAYFSKRDTENSVESYLYLVLSVQDRVPGEYEAFVAEKDHGPVHSVTIEVV